MRPAFLALVRAPELRTTGGSATGPVGGAGVCACCCINACASAFARRVNNTIPNSTRPGSTVTAATTYSGHQMS
ncbi:MAG: hypothetical protein IPH07_30930 [Deltaproteobacteria bacterium]|nr:hypothetical protein [Deltaproteobacteria bacterium]